MIGLAGAAIVLGRRAGGRDRLVGAVLVSAFAVPPVLLWLFSQAVPSFVSRYVICSTVALTGVAMLGLDAVRRRAGLALGAAVLAGLALIDLRSGVRSEGQPFKYEDPPAVTAFITDGSQPGDAIGFGSGGLRMVLDDYAAPGRPLPVDVALAPGGEAWRQHDLYGREVSPTALATRLAAVRRLWLVTDPTDHRYPSFGPFAPLRSAVLGSFRPVEVRSFPGMDVTLYVR
jgi:hypothetical protein